MRAFSPATPPARRPTSVGAFSPASISGLRSRLLDANTFTSPIDSKYYLKDSSTTNTHLPRQGRAWLFDGTNDYGAAPTTLTVAGSNTCTVTAWVKMTGTPASLASIFTETTPNSGFTRLGMFIDTSNKVVIVSRDTVTTDTGSSITLTGVAALAVGTWYHVAVTYDAATDTRSIYINGVLDFTSSATPIATFTAGAPAVVSVGCYGAAASNFLPGSVRDVRVYNTAKTAGEVTAIYNQSRTGSGIFDTTGLIAAYPCNEESGTTGYDISGNGNHLTLTNITQATFHAADTGVTANRNNAEGYRLSGSVYIPKRLSDSLAADGNALTVSGRAAYHGCAEVPCITGDGSTVYADIGTHSLTGDFEISFWAKYMGGTDVTHGPMFIGGGDAGGGSSYLSYIWYRPLTDRWYWTVDGESAVNISGTVNGTLDDAQWHKIRAIRSGTTHTLMIDDTVIYTGTKTVITMTLRRILQSYGTNYYVNGRMSDLKLTYDGVTWHFPLQDGPGSSNTNRDIAWVKSDGTGGVVSSAIVNGTVSTIWGNRVPGNVEDWCVKYGGRIAANGAFVAGMLTGGNAADGSAKTLVAGKFGNPFSRLNLNPATAAELNGKNIQTAYEDLPCVTGNGTNVYVNLGSQLMPSTGDFIASFWWFAETVANYYRLFDQSNYGVLQNTDATGVHVYDGVSISPSVPVNLGAWNLITLSRTSGNLTVTTTSTATITSSLNPPVANTTFFSVGGFKAKGRVSNLQVTSGGVTTYFPLSDGSGADIAWYKSDGTKGVVSSALQGTLTNVWANKTDGSKVAATKYALRAIVTRETEFNRVASDGDDRFLIYDNALSGADLTNVEGYLA